MCTCVWVLLAHTYIELEWKYGKYIERQKNLNTGDSLASSVQKFRSNNEHKKRRMLFCCCCSLFSFVYKTNDVILLLLFTFVVYIRFGFVIFFSSLTTFAVFLRFFCTVFYAVSFALSLCLCHRLVNNIKTYRLPYTYTLIWTTFSGLALIFVLVSKCMNETATDSRKK